MCTWKYYECACTPRNGCGGWTLCQEPPLPCGQCPNCGPMQWEKHPQQLECATCATEGPLVETDPTVRLLMNLAPVPKMQARELRGPFPGMPASRERLLSQHDERLFGPNAYKDIRNWWPIAVATGVAVENLHEPDARLYPTSDDCCESYVQRMAELPGAPISRYEARKRYTARNVSRVRERVRVEGVWLRGMGGYPSLAANPGEGSSSQG